MLDLVERALALRAAPLFAPLSAEELVPVAERASEVELAPGERLFAEGDVGDSLYVVTEGTVRAERDGQELARLGPGECVGELAVLDLEPRSATVTAATAARLVRLWRDDLFDLLGDHPELVRALAGVLVARIRAKRT